MKYTNMDAISAVVLFCISSQIYGRPLGHMVFRRSTEASDTFKPFDDGMMKHEETVIRPQNSLVPNTHQHAQGYPMLFNLPPWLMYFSEIWNMIIARQQDLRVKFPDEFESENDVNESNRFGANANDEGESPEWSNEQENDDVALHSRNTFHGSATLFDEANEIPEIGEFQNEIEFQEGRFEAEPEHFSPHMSMFGDEAGVHDDSETQVWDSNERDNTETDNHMQGTNAVNDLSEAPEMISNHGTHHMNFHGQSQSGFMPGFINPTIFNSPEPHEQQHNVGDSPVQSDDPTETHSGLSHLNRPSRDLTAGDDHGMTRDDFIRAQTLNSVYDERPIFFRQRLIPWDSDILNFRPNFLSSSADFSLSDNALSNTFDNERDSSS